VDSLDLLTGQAAFDVQVQTCEGKDQRGRLCLSRRGLRRMGIDDVLQDE
jgi:hypothetical protein